MTEPLLADFPYTTAEEWLAQITKDLKGRLPADLYWSPDGDIKVNPFVHAEAVTQRTEPLPSFGRWLIGESFVVTSEAEANQQILEALCGGVESLRIRCKDSVSWEGIFNGVQLPLVHVMLDIDGDSNRALDDFLDYATAGFSIDELRLTINSPHTDTPANVRFCTSALQTENIVDGLVTVILKALESVSYDPVHLMMSDLSLSLGMHYLIEIARLRALRILWTNLASALGFSVSQAFAIEAHTQLCSPNDDPYTHMIRSTVMGVSAVLGGADRIFIHPSVGSHHTASFYRHVARNMHHLLRFESKFTEIDDPVAGAYYIDRLTHDLVEKSWPALQLRIKESNANPL